MYQGNIRKSGGEMNKYQETLYFWYEPISKKFLTDFECAGSPNIKLVYDIKRNKIKFLGYHNGGKLIEKRGK
jgi:hypothetical protein